MLLVLREQLVHKVPRDPLEPPELLEQKVTPEQLVQSAHKDPPVHKVLRDPLERPVHKAHKALLVLRERLVLLEQLVGI